MKSIIKIVIFIAIVLPLSAAQSFSQSNILPNPSGQTEPEIAASLQDFERLKGEVNLLLQRNEKLKVQYKWLKDEIANLDKRIAEEKANIQKIKKDFQIGTKTELSSEDTGAYRYKEVEKEMLLQETKKAALKAKSMDYEDTKNIWALQLANLDYRKRELELEVKMKTLECKAEQDSRLKFISRLKGILGDNLDKEKELKKKIENYEQDVNYSPDMVGQLESQNKALKQNLEQLNDKIDYAKKENKLLSDKRILAKKSLDFEFSGLRQEKNILEHIVHDMEKQYEEINRMVEDSLQEKKLVSDLMQEVIKIDKENQALRDKINQLQSKEKKQ